MCQVARISSFPIFPFNSDLSLKQGFLIDSGVMKFKIDNFDFHGMRIALEDLKLERIAVIYPGKKRYPLSKKIEVVPFDEILGGIKGIFK